VSDLKTATSAIAGVLVAQHLPSTEAALYTATAGTTAKLASARLVNTDSASRTVTLSVVKSGGSAGASNRILAAVTLTAGQSMDLGSLGWLAAGDFISGVASVADTVSIVISGVVFSSTSVGAPTGIQDDAYGTPGRVNNSGTVGNTNVIGSGSNRYLLAALLCNVSGWVPWASYDTLTLSCSDGAMTRLVSADIGGGGQFYGSVHFFGRANPTSNSTQTLTANAADTGITFDLTLASMSFSGVASVAGATSSAPASSVALNAAISSAAGHRPFWATGSDVPLMDFNRRVRAFNGGSASGQGVGPVWLMMADALGAASLAATSSNNAWHAAVGVDLVPA
jgi:hypothetical protein